MEVLQHEEDEVHNAEPCDDEPASGTEYHTPPGESESDGSRSEGK